ncbi:MAG: choice-of-anchor J domain-containing protein [Prevotella sp.]|jgi:Cleaved Adhesin Domain.|nr:choice-of-anchor J domain-containing protein [Prevotella sp.]
MATQLMKKKLFLFLVALLAATGVKADEWGFENGLDGWIVIDGNNDGYTWTLTSAIPSTWPSYANITLDWYHSGSNAVCSGSYINGVGALTPNEYLVSPQFKVSTGCQISFWAAAVDATYAADHFGVFVSTGTPVTSNFKLIKEWTLTGSREFVGGRQEAPRRVGTWHYYTADLSAYTNQKIYVAIRHFNCNNQYILIIDDVSIVDDGMTVGIDNVNVKLNDNNNFYYDIQGRHVVHPTKGLYIQNGKKIVVK